MPLRRLVAWFRARRAVRDMAEEIETHRAMTERRLHAAGLSAEDAAAESRRIMGNQTLAREDARAVSVWPWLDATRQDVRYALRNLRRQPGFALLALTTLGASIGLNTTIFTVFNAVFLRPWAVSEPSGVFELSITHDAMGTQVEEFSLDELRHFQEHTRTAAGVIATTCVAEREPACRVKVDDQPAGAIFTSRNFFTVLGVAMERGAGFDGPEDRADAVAIISWTLWQRRFGADPNIVGRTIRLNDAIFTVAGVTPEPFRGTTFGRKDVWVPLSARALVHPHVPLPIRVRVAGRLQRGISRARASSEFDVLSRAFRSALPGSSTSHDRMRRPGRIDAVGTSLNPNASKTSQGYAVFGLLGMGTLLVLVLACANVGNLLLARGAARRREIAVRLSLGAARSRVIRQLLTESLVLATAAALLGLLLAVAGPGWILDWVYVQFGGLGTRPFSATPDALVLAATGGLAVLTCLAFGAVPAFHSVRESVVGVLKKDTGAGGSRLRLRNGLLALQIVVSVMLLVGAALLVRSVRHVTHVDLGFTAADTSVVSIDPPASYTAAQQAQLAGRLIDTFGDGPDGLDRRVAVASAVPFERNPAAQVKFRVPGETWDRFAEGVDVSPPYFDVLRMTVVAGRALNNADAGRHSIVLNESLAAALWPGEMPIGKVLTVDKVPSEVVGVTKDVATPGRLFRNGWVLTIYRPLSAATVSTGLIPQLLVRAGDARAVNEVTAKISALDGRADVLIYSLQDNIDRRLAGSRMGAALASALGLIAITFASIGVFGVVAYLVQQRTREIGVRVALGAQSRQVVASVLRSSSRALAIGLAVGLGASLAGSKLLASSLIGISPLDPVAYAAVLLVLACAGVVAVLVPALRATRVDPATALRCE